MAEIKCVHTSDTLMRGMNPHLIASAGLFVVSELLPYLPCKENSVIQIGVRGLHLAKLVPDDVFESFKKASQANSTQHHHHSLLLQRIHLFTSTTPSSSSPEAECALP
jgi:hypothetical protein